MFYVFRYDRVIVVFRFVYCYFWVGDVNLFLVMCYLFIVDVLVVGKDMFGFGYSYMVNVFKVFWDLFYIVRYCYKFD